MTSEHNNNNNDAASASSLRRTRVCRLDDPAIALTPAGSSTTTPLQALETYLEEGIEAAEEDVREASVPPIEYKLNADVVWTKARRPMHPWHTVLGFAEEAQDESVALANPCCFRVYQSTTTEVVQEEDTGCACSIPTPPWQNKEYKEDCHHDSSDDRTTKRIDWIDLTGFGEDASTTTTPLFPTARCVLHALRSLLGTDQAASPWTHKQQQQQQPTPDAVVLALPAAQEVSTLHRFRVSDASPSWALHAVVPAWRTPRGTTRRIRWPTTTTTTASLWIYRRLPPRDGLSRWHPVTQQPPPVPECLWETVVVAKQNTSDDDNNNNNHREQQDDDDEPPEISYRLVAPPYLNPAEHYPTVVQMLQDNLQLLQQEAKQIAHWTAWPEQQHYQAAAEDDSSGGGAPWNVFPLCYCFPANDVSQRTWLDLTTAAVPQTTRILQQLGPVLRTALFSRLDPGARLEAHTGWQDLANHVVRLHVPLDIPTTQGVVGLCGTWVDGCVMTHQAQSPWVCFDDSKTHRAFNYSTAYRTVLILDLARPSAWPPGTATGGHSEELDAFIQQMSAPR